MDSKLILCVVQHCDLQLSVHRTLKMSPQKFKCQWLLDKELRLGLCLPLHAPETTAFVETELSLVSIAESGTGLFQTVSVAGREVSILWDDIGFILSNVY